MRSLQGFRRAQNINLVDLEKGGQIFEIQKNPGSAPDTKLKNLFIYSNSHCTFNDHRPKTVLVFFSLKFITWLLVKINCRAITSLLASVESHNCSDCSLALMK